MAPSLSLMTFVFREESDADELQERTVSSSYTRETSWGWKCVGGSETLIVALFLKCCLQTESRMLSPRPIDPLHALFASTALSSVDLTASLLSLVSPEAPDTLAGNTSIGLRPWTKTDGCDASSSFASPSSVVPVVLGERISSPLPPLWSNAPSAQQHAVATRARVASDHLAASFRSLYLVSGGPADVAAMPLHSPVGVTAV